MSVRNFAFDFSRAWALGWRATAVEWGMLRFHTSRSASDAVRYYTHLSQGDYLAQDGATVGVWGGKLAARLGLSGDVKAEDFAALANNRHPVTGEKLTPRMKDNRRVGWDVTMDVSKSASILWALGGDQRIPELVKRVSQEVLSEVMEPDMRVRVRANGQDGDKATGQAVWSSFLHGTSRPSKDDGLPDMQLHTHNFIANLTESDGRYMAAEIGEMWRKADYYQSVFNAKMAKALSDELGYRVERRGKGWEVAGISRALIEKFSRRTEEIEAEAKKRGITDAKEKDGLGAKTRRQKRKDLNHGELRSYWKSRLTEDEAGTIAEVVKQARTGGTEGTPPAMTADQAVDWATRHLFEKDAVVEDWKIGACALRHGVGSVAAEGVDNALNNRIKQGKLLGRKRDGKRLLTTPEALAREKALIDFARDGKGRRPPLAEANRPFTRDWLNKEQKRAVRHLWNSCDRVMLVRGAPGVGKTTLLQEAVEGIEANGKKVFAFAPSAEASRGTLREAGFPDAETVARLLKDEQLQARVRGQVLLVDEGGLLGSKDAADFFALCDRLSCRAIVVGDRRQHGAVERPGALKLLETEAGLPVAEVTAIQRQAGKYKDIVARLSRGDTEDGLKRLEGLGWVQEIAGAEREQQLAVEYVNAVSQRKQNGQAVTALVISPSHAEGDRIADTIRAELKRRGKITGDERELLRLDRLDLSEAERGDALRYSEGEVVQFFQNAVGFKRGERVTVTGRDELGHVCVATAAGQVKALRLDQADKFQVFRRRTLKLAAGDRVRITGNGLDQSGRHRLNNGGLYTVAGFNAAGSVVLDNGWVVAQDYGQVAQGYTITSQASQSKTVDQVIIGMSAQSFPAMSREGLLVSVSRGRTKASIYTDDLEGLHEAVRRTEERLTATELLKEQAQRRARTRHMQRWAAMTGQAARRIAAAVWPREPEPPRPAPPAPGWATPELRPSPPIVRPREPGDDKRPPERTR